MQPTILAAIPCILGHRLVDVRRRPRAARDWAVGREERYRPGSRHRQDRSPDPLVLRHPVGGLRRRTSFQPKSMLAMVPSYMPWRMFWVYFVGFALIAASLSIATKMSGAVVRPAVRNHDVPLCGDVASSGSDHRRRPNPMDDRHPGNVVRRRRLGFGGNCDGRKSRRAG